MSEDLGAIAVTTGVNALVGLIGSVPWPEMVSRVRGVLSRRGGEVEPGLAQALEDQGDDEREQRLATALTRLSSEELDAVLGELKSLSHQTTVTVSGGKSAVNSGSGDQNVTFN
ncbi:hypothetical protein OH786_15715 [Streptomyces atratus]|uniref:Uncharacterized protein n=1 Tax=Streptomyces atratus TaxID=1893 RepID=A0A1K2EP12_STRAR|nr:hypothetical protein [Streptomyces atratus]SFY36589.1 hypothetical protein SAMN02787144_1020128 [Streptomyces atratus]